MTTNSLEVNDFTQRSSLGPVLPWESVSSGIQLSQVANLITWLIVSWITHGAMNIISKFSSPSFDLAGRYML